MRIETARLVFVAALLAAAALLVPTESVAQGPLTSGQLVVQGSQLTLYSDAETNDADQTINVGERARVRTCFGGVEDACGSVLPGDPRIAGLAVEAELIGPEAPQGIPLSTVPGGAFVVPGLQQEGDYRLENIRLVESGTGRVLGAAVPSVAFLRVREILLASATVRTLTLADLRARGIELSQENFQAFDFAVGFAFGSEIVEFELPLLYDGFGSLTVLEKARVRLDGLPPEKVREIERWKPPDIIPFVLETPEEERVRLQPEEDQELRLPLFGAIVMPGTVSYLNQFFEARLIVANGAPASSDVELTNLGGALRLPNGNVMRWIASEPSVAPGQVVPAVEAGGGRVLSPGEQASAGWTVEGLVAGTHTLGIDVTGQIERPGRDPLPVVSRIQAAVEVVDARFNLTFSHPDVVREGEAYSLFVTVTNLSRATQNLISVDLDEQHITGATREDPADDLRRTIQTLAPGQAETVEYRLVAGLTGKVVATTFQSTSSAGQGTIRLRTGVGELGIPLSPATLLLPRFSDQLDAPRLPNGDFLRANVRFLGLAYSLAVAPSAHVPPDLPRVIPSDVERRAVDFAQAGHRRFLGEGLLETLEVFALDQLGNRHPLEELDELRRRLSKGEAMAEELAALLRGEQQARGLGAVGLLDHWAETASYTDPWMMALVVPDGGAPAPTLEIRRPTENGLGVLARPAGEEGIFRTLPFGEIYPVRRTSGSGERVPLAVVGHLADGELFEVVLRNEGAAAAAGRLILVLPDDVDPRAFRRVDMGRVDVPVGGAVGVVAGASVAGPGGGGFATYHLSTGLPAGGSPVESAVTRPPFRLVGAVQDFRLRESGPDALGNMMRPNRYGNGLVYLFNRPPDEEAAAVVESFRIRSTFEGLDTAGAPASGVAEKVGTATFVQDDRRVVAVRYSTPISALIDPSDSQPLLDHEHLLDTSALIDEWGETLSPNLPPPTLEVDPLHVGGLVEGRVLRGTGEPADGARVQLARLWAKETLFGTVYVPEILGEVTTAADGRFYFDYVETPHWDPAVIDRFVLRASVPEGDDPDLEPADVVEVSSRVRLQNRVTRVNVALLGRGVVTGRLVYADDGSPVPGGKVAAASTLFNDYKQVEVEADGSFRIGGVAVGPITLTGSDEDLRRVYATVGVEQPGQTVDVLLQLPRTPPRGSGTVTGTVVRASDGDPVAGARVAVYSEGNWIASKSSDGLGRFRFENVPAGQVSLQASAWEVSRTAAFTDLILAAGATSEATLRLADGDDRSVSGRVLFHDPLTNTDLPIEGAVAFVRGPGVFAYTGADGRYLIEGLPLQGLNESPYQVTVIDYSRQLQGSVPLQPVTDVSPPVIPAQDLVLESMRGSIDGVVLDPLGRPIGGVEVVLYPARTTTTAGNGAFSFSDVSVGNHRLIAHVGDGLAAGQVGYFTQSEVRVVYGGHRPFVNLRLVGGGVVTLHTTTATATGVLTPIYYKPTYYHDASRSIKVQGAYTETTTDPNGNLELRLPVGEYAIVAYNPFHGIQEIRAEVGFAGQTIHHEIVFEDAATVRGQVVDVDGHTPVPDLEVTLSTEHLLPQKQRTDAQGNFRFELVPKGSVAVSAAGLVGTVERVGRTYGSVSLGGQVLDLVVQMKAQGSVRGQVLERFNGDLQPLAFAQYYVRENSYPYRRLPSEGTFYLTDGEGRYEVSHLYAGNVTVVARDSGQVTRSGSARGNIDTDWEVVDLPDIVMSTDVGRLSAVIRDPVTGGPVADAQLRLSNGEAGVSGPQGEVAFDALPLGNYSLYAFHAPTGRSGRVGGLVLSSPGQAVHATVYLDQRGEVRGTVYDDEARTLPVVGATVQLSGQTAGGRVTALATASSAEGEEGRFSFLGIPEGTFDLEAAEQTSPRRARAEATLTETSPVADVAMVLEPVGDVFVRLFEKLLGGDSPVDVASSLFSVRMTQTGYDFTQVAPSSGDAYRFPDLLLRRSAVLSTQEQVGERRSASANFSDLLPPPPIDGSGTAGDPYRLLLRPKGVVRVTVVDGGGAPVPQAAVTLNASGTRFPSVADAAGQVTFAGVPAGSLTASATSPTVGTGGTARGTLTYDDEVVELGVALAPAVSAHGVVYLPVADDRLGGDPGPLVPAPGIIVELRDSTGDTQLVLTDEAGAYRFDVLATGGYTVAARDNNGEQVASGAGSLSGPNGFDNEIPPLVLDASPPRIVSIVPPSGLEGVSRTATVEIVFSEPLSGAVLPNGGSTSNFFRLSAADGSLATGSWTSFVDAAGFQVVRFTPSVPYLNFTTYSLRITGGSGGVRDRVDRPLTASGNVGANFKTADGIGPQVIATEPPLDRPVDPAASVRFDFNEAVEGPDEAFDGDGNADAVELEALRDTGAWVRLPVAIFLTRSGYSVEMQPLPGVSVQGDTLRRRVRVLGLTDRYGNPMPTYEASYRLFDDSAPVVDAVPYPDGAPEGDLIQGVDYQLVPAISGVDDVSAEQPSGDLLRVDYYFEDPVDPAFPVAPAFSAVAAPFAYPFVGAYSGDGTTPRPFPVWVQAVDTSGNRSNVVQVEMRVLPNSAPEVGAIVAEATAPVAGTFYAGSSLTATVSGLDDADSSQLTLSVELRADGEAAPIADSPDRLVTRPAGGWAEVADETFDFTLPLDLAEGTPLYFVARALDSQGAAGSAESERHPVADDATPAAVSGFVSRLDDGRGEDLFFIGESFYFELRASDAETAVDTVEVTLDRTDLFPEPIVVTLVAGSGDLYRTGQLTVPFGSVDDEIPLVATARVTDVGGNEVERTLDFRVAPERDPTAPVARWVTPLQGAPWPAGHDSLVSDAGAALLLRVEASDLTEDAGGNLLPGNLVSVRFRGPMRDPVSGAIVVADTWVVGERVSGNTSSGTWRALWRVPDGVAAGTELPFEVEAIDSGNTTTVERVNLVAVPARRVYEGVTTAVAPTDPMLAAEADPAGAVFLLDGTTLSLRPQEDGSVRQLPALHLYAGGDDTAGLVERPSVLTAPEITTYDSVILYHPLELTLTEALTVGWGCRVDMSGRGLLGNTPLRRVVLPGETQSEQLAGGSHGGRGGPGSFAGGFNRTDLTVSGTVYDSLRDPHLPGSGGTSINDSTPAGAGGGVVRLFADGATVRLDGDLLAEGGDGSGAGGAGGAIRLVAGRLEGSGRISAAGGSGSAANWNGGGGGGRVAVSYRELADDFDPAAQVDAEGGENTQFTGALRRGGAGTVFLQPLDPASGAPQGSGRLRVADPGDLPTSLTPLPALGDGVVAGLDPLAAEVVLDVPRVTGELAGDELVLSAEDGTPLGSFVIVGQQRFVDAGTPRVRLTVDAAPEALAAADAELAAGRPVAFHGRSRLEAVEAAGRARLVADDDLMLGPAGGESLNDRALVTLAGGARALLRGEAPVVTIVAEPPPGSELVLGSTVELSWQADDPLGLTRTESTWSLDGSSAGADHFDERLTAAAGPVSLSIPLDAAEGEVTYELTATDLAGRAATGAVTWTVLPNEAPSVSIALADGSLVPAPAGYALSVVVSATDREGLDSLTLVASGPVAAASASQSVDVGGTEVQVTFTVDVLPTADGSAPVVLQAMAADLGGATAASEPMTVAVEPNAEPAASLALAAGAADRVKPGESTQVTVEASDPDELDTIELRVTGPATAASELREVAGTTVSETFTVTAAADAELSELVVSAVVTDRLGSSFTTAPVTIPIVDDTDAPVVSITFEPQQAAYLAGDTVTVTASATDDVGVASLTLFVDDQELTSDGTPIVYVWTLPPISEPTIYTVIAEATDPAGNNEAQSRDLPVEPLADDVPPEIAFTCPSSGAVLPNGYQVTLSAQASDDLGIAWVDFYADGSPTPFARVTPESGAPTALDASVSFLLPASAATSTFRAEVVDSGNNMASADTSVDTVVTVDLFADGAGTNDWASLAGQVTVLRSGTLTLDQPVALGGLILLPGASLTHAASAPGAERSLELAVAGTTYVACGAAVDASARGYAANQTYPGAGTPGNDTGGSHVGVGGVDGGPAATTYGSVHYPRENGGGGRSNGRGGGVVHLTAGRLHVDGAVRANGSNASTASAGGSVWLEAGTLAGTGSLEARGGDSTGCCSIGSGGGGALAVDYQALDAGATLLDRVTARGGGTNVVAGAGSALLRGPDAPLGHLVLANGGPRGLTRLPSLGSGVAQAGSGGTLLVADRAPAPAYFAGHQVEIHDGASGAFKGVARLADLGPDGVTWTVDGVADLAPGDRWQGVYRFDRMTLADGLMLESDDPVRVAGDVSLPSGTVTVQRIEGGDLDVAAGAVLRPFTTLSSASAEGLTIELGGELRVAAGATIDASGLGYPVRQTYPGAGTPGSDTGGSHMGIGGVDSGPAATSFGSVYFPFENGGGGYHGSRGGGAVRITAAGVRLDGAVRANGGNSSTGGGGGSIWIETVLLAGSGSLEARGGDSTNCCSLGAGGGGAIAVGYTALEAGSPLLDEAQLQTGANNINGGAGTLYTRGPGATYGDLRVDNRGPAGLTVLPSLGSGLLAAGSGGAVLTTDAAAPVQPYFVGHWVEVYDASGVLRGTGRVVAIDGTLLTLDRDLGVAAGDAWQGVYLFDDAAVVDGADLASADPIRLGGEIRLGDGARVDTLSTESLVVESGTVTARNLEVGTLRVASGATLTQWVTPGSATPESLTIDAGEVIVEAGGTIDVSGRGYPARQTYPGEGLPGNDTAGSHIGVGGIDSGPAATTFGSLHFPQENGGGGYHGSRGGGTLEIVAGRLQVDGALRANGGNSSTGGGGGSIWIEVDDLAGAGTLEARGGNSTSCCTFGSGGGGAVAVGYGVLEAGSTLLDSVPTHTGTTNILGGAGSVVVRSPAEPLGHLTVTNANIFGRTELPSLGSGVAQAGSGGAVLVSDRTAAVPAYFVGHQVEIYDGATGAFEGVGRVVEIGADGLTLTLDGVADVAPGDRWQGVYRFDRMTLADGTELASADPVRIAGETLVASGTVTTRRLFGGDLRVAPGAVLRQWLSTSALPETLTLDLTGELWVEAGGAIDVSGRGYPANQSYPGEGTPGSDSGGSHMGLGGVDSPPAAATYGSVYTPLENGAGGRSGSRGGGAVAIVADGGVRVDGAIRANGQTASIGGAGGSIWLETGLLAGDGTLEARGGDSVNCCTLGAGGGGAIAVGYQALEAGALVLDNAVARTGFNNITGGAGTIYSRGPGANYGDLRVDNFGPAGLTVLPSLGSGTLAAGSAGEVLATDAAAPFQPYFAGHWVEVYDGASGSLRGAGRVASIDGTTLTLDRSVDAQPGDLWQGVYLFDDVTVANGADLRSGDPIRLSGEIVLADGAAGDTFSAASALITSGTVTARRLDVGSLRVADGAVLTHWATPSSALPESLVIEADTVVVEAGGAIDVSGRGYPANQTYPGHQTPGGDTGGSHVGIGGVDSNPPAAVFGSVYTPFENGGGGRAGSRGGGSVVIDADDVTIDGAVHANGQTASVAGGGGSIFIQADSLAGTGVLEARGGNSVNCCTLGAGGGGAIAVDYGFLAGTSTLLDTATARGGTGNIVGGAGSVYLRGPLQTYGDLVFDNAGVNGNSELPALGTGVALAGSTGDRLVTDRATAVPAYFIGHWVRVEDADRVEKGVWRIGAVDGTAVTLLPNDDETISVVEGDEWSGVYRVASLTVGPGVNLTMLDDVEEVVGGPVALSVGNLEAPAWDASGVSLSTGVVAGSYRVEVAATAVADDDGVAELRLVAGDRLLATAWDGSGAAFHWPGAPGERLKLIAVDGHGVLRRAATLRLPPLPDGGWAAADGERVAAPSRTAPAEPAAADGGEAWAEALLSASLDEGWRAAFPFGDEAGAGAALASADALHLVAWDGDGWNETVRVATGATPWSVVRDGDVLWVALPGEVRAYELSGNGGAPREIGRLAGSSHRALVALPEGGVALGSPGFAASWIELRVEDLNPADGDGYRAAVSLSGVR